MILTDTHTHLYLDAFDDDRDAVIQRSIDQQVRYMLLPNIDEGSIDPMLALCDTFPGTCFPMLGLHPTSVKENYKEALKKIFSRFGEREFVAIGEIGIDLYWDKTYFVQQQAAFRQQIELAMESELPIVIHCRDSFDAIISILGDYGDSGLRGVFHCFTGTMAEARQAIGLGFKLGIGGVVTFKNSGLDEVVREVDMKDLLLETDSPFLAPVPFRGRRNESAYINIIAKRVSEIKQIAKEEVAAITTQNALSLFNFPTYE